MATSAPQYYDKKKINLWIVLVAKKMASSAPQNYDQKWPAPHLKYVTKRKNKTVFE